MADCQINNQSINGSYVDYLYSYGSIATRLSLLGLVAIISGKNL